MQSMNRRYFLAAASTALTRGAAPARRKVMVCLIDGFGPEYIARSEMPNLQRAIKAGTYKLGRSAMPSLTNVNSASFATGSYPEAHGITANTFFDPELGKIVEMADAKYLRRPTLFTHAHKKGWKTAFVGAKEKIRSLIGASAHSSISAEKQGIPMYEAEAFAGLRAEQHLFNAGLGGEDFLGFGDVSGLVEIDVDGAAEIFVVDLVFVRNGRHGARGDAVLGQQAFGIHRAGLGVHAVIGAEVQFQIRLVVENLAETLVEIL